MPIWFCRSIFADTTLIVATCISGIMAGFFWTYAFNVGMALHEVDGPTYAELQSLLNENVRHPLFFVFFFSGPLFSVTSLIVRFEQRRTVWFWLVLLSTIIYVFGVIILTHQVHLPLNYYIESWPKTNLPAGWMGVRERWNDANMARVLASFSSFLLCVVALRLKSKI